MNVLIIKLGAAGDVVRTTTLLRRLTGQITWLTEAKNTVLLEGVKEGLKCVCWEQRDQTKDTLYDLVINLEDWIVGLKLLIRSGTADSDAITR